MGMQTPDPRHRDGSRPRGAISSECGRFDQFIGSDQLNACVRVRQFLKADGEALPGEIYGVLCPPFREEFGFCDIFKQIPMYRLAHKGVLPLAFAEDSRLIQETAGDIDVEVGSPDLSYLRRRHVEAFLRVQTDVVATNLLERPTHVLREMRLDLSFVDLASESKGDRGRVGQNESVVKAEQRIAHVVPVVP